jgi:hypothetical protein
MEYHFHPPYFRSDPHPSFAEAWEVFCCRLLNLENDTNAIRRRKPPEQGVDLIWQTEGIAYQCKSVEHELGKFRIDKAKASLKTALEYQSHIGWKKYSICTNVMLTGTHEMALKRLWSDIDVYDHSRWQGLCQRFHEHIADYFCVLIPIVPAYLTNEIKKINRRFVTDFLPRFSSQEPLIHVLVGLHAYQNAFDLQIPASFTSQEFLLLLKELFLFPDPLTVSTSGEATFVTHYLCLGEQEIPLHQKLGALQVGDRPLFTVLRLTVRSSASRTETSGLYEGVARKRVAQSKPRPGTLEARAVEQYTQRLKVALDEAAKRVR